MNPTVPGAQGEEPDLQPVLITASELARMMRISTRTLWRLQSAGKLIAPVKIGGSTRWRLADVRRWIAAGCPAPDQPSART
jgi:predicted DNA-binding transcriptional regulator AlpA